VLDKNKYFFGVLCIGIAAAALLETFTSTQRALFLESLWDTGMMKSVTAAIPDNEPIRPDFCGRNNDWSRLEEMRRSSK
jgi:hypothetical protein